MTAIDPAALAVAIGYARIDLQAAAMRASLATFYADDSHADVDAHAEYELDRLTAAARHLVQLVDQQDRQEKRLDDCTHGADCQVHPDANTLHNFDREGAS